MKQALAITWRLKGLILFGLGVTAILLFSLSGCMFIQKGFDVVVTPPSGHPPFEIEIRATDMGGGTYTFELPGRSVQQPGSSLQTTVWAWPWEVRVVWTDGYESHVATAAVALENEPPVIHWPRVNGIDPSYNAWILPELERAVFDFNPFETTPLWPGDQVYRFGVFDPEGDEWKITKVEVLWYGAGFVDGREVTVYVPPFQPGVYHTTWFIGRGEILPNSFILYPPYKARWDARAERWTCPTPEKGYRPLRVQCNEGTNIPISPSAPLTILIEVEDEYGAHSERMFDFVMDGTGCFR